LQAAMTWPISWINRSKAGLCNPIHNWRWLQLSIFKSNWETF
jgi:hypothetical protein